MFNKIVNLDQIERKIANNKLTKNEQNNLTCI